MVDEFTTKPDMLSWGEYMFNGFTLLQFTLSKMVLEKYPAYVPGSDNPIQVVMAPMKTPEFSKDDFMD